MVERQPLLRRAPVKGHRGIYYRDAPKGRVYEITYYDSDGRRRWKTVGPSLKEAESARADIVRKKHEGVRVSPARTTFGEFAASWLDGQSHLRPRTHELYEQHLRSHLVPLLGSKKLAVITEDDVLSVVKRLRKAGKAEKTIREVLLPLSLVLSEAARRGMIQRNPVANLRRSERPKPTKREKRILDAGQVADLLYFALPTYRPVLATAVMSGLRLSELLALTWDDLDFAAGEIHVRYQLSRAKRGEPAMRVALKTRDGRRSVVLAPALATLLKRHRLASPHAGQTDFVFVTAVGTPFYSRNVSSRGLEKAAQRAGIDGEPTLRFHDLRHTYASALIAGGEDVYWVAKQLGHADPSVTLRTYAHEFSKRSHAARTAETLDGLFGAALAGSSL
jgi:integrase